MLAVLLCGQRGTEAAMGNPTSAAPRMVVLEGAVVKLPIGEAELGLPRNWRIVRACALRASPLRECAWYD